MPPDFAADVDDFDRRIEEFELTWQRGTVPSLSDFLPDDLNESGEFDRQHLLVELVKVDLEYRWRNARHNAHSQNQTESDPEVLRLEQYTELLPELDQMPSLPIDLVCEEYRVRFLWGDCPKPGEYIERFPEIASELLPQLAAVNAQIEAETVVRADRTDLPTTTPPHDSSSFVASSPQWIGKYHVVGLLDEGGQAWVYRALHPTLKSELAIKMAKRPIDVGDPHRQRLIAEGRLLSELRHPNIVQIYDLDFDNGRPFLVMEYVRGMNLAQFAAQNELSVTQMASLLAKIAHAVSTAHTRGVVHQDIKPGNIVVDAQDVPRLIDFGLASLQDAWSEDELVPGSISGTAPFMAPEQARGETENVQPTSDVFALGAVLYFLLTGRPPFAGRDVNESLDLAARCDFDQDALNKPEIPTVARDMCLRAMAADPKNRFKTVNAFAEQLDTLASPPRGRRRLFGGIGSILVVAALAGGLWLAFGPKGADSPPSVQPVEGPSDVAKVSRHPQGRLLRKDFRLKIDMPGGKVVAGTLAYVDGQRFVVSADTRRACYVGIWYVDGEGKAGRIFPSGAQDSILRPDVPRDLYRSEATTSEGREFIHIVASNRPLHELVDQQLESYVTEEPGDGDPRGLRPLDQDEPAVAEFYIEFRVAEAR